MIDYTMLLIKAIIIVSIIIGYFKSLNDKTFKNGRIKIIEYILDVFNLRHIENLHTYTIFQITYYVFLYMILWLVCAILIYVTYPKKWNQNMRIISSIFLPFVLFLLMSLFHFIYMKLISKTMSSIFLMILYSNISLLSLLITIFIFVILYEQHNVNETGMLYSELKRIRQNVPFLNTLKGFSMHIVYLFLLKNIILLLFMALNPHKRITNDNVKEIDNKSLLIATIIGITYVILGV